MRFILALSLLALSGCDLGFNSDRFREDFHSTYPLAAGGRLEVENQNGAIEISGWEKDSVDVTGTKYASSQRLLDAMKIDIVASAGSVRIRTVVPEFEHGGRGARYSIRVPRRALLDRISSSNGSIRVEDVEGVARLHTSNGAVKLTRSSGELEAETSNGSIDIREHTGNARVKTSNGSIQAEASGGSFHGYTSNGSITVRLSAPNPAHTVELESSNGRIDLTFETAKVPETRVNTSNSSIAVHLPASVNARLRAHTSHSSITSEFDVQVQGGRIDKAHLEGTVGTGGPVIDLSTSNGAIKILKL